MKSDEIAMFGRTALMRRMMDLYSSAGVAALHGLQDAVGAVLHRQVQVVHQLRDLGVGVDQALGEFLRVAGDEAQALDAGDLGHVFEQQGEVGDLAVVHRAAVGVDVLPQQHDFLDALGGQAGDFGQHVLEAARDFLAAGVGHHAVAAVLAAAFHDRDIGDRAFDLGRRQVVELLDFREADVDLGRPLCAARLDHLRQAVQGLRAEHHVDVGRALDDRRAFLRGDAAADADHQVGLAALEFLQAAEVGKHFFLRLFAHRAGVEAG